MHTDKRFGSETAFDHINDLPEGFSEFRQTLHRANIQPTEREYTHGFNDLSTLYLAKYPTAVRELCSLHEVIPREVSFSRKNSSPLEATIATDTIGTFRIRIDDAGNYRLYTTDDSVVLSESHNYVSPEEMSNFLIDFAISPKDIDAARTYAPSVLDPRHPVATTLFEKSLASRAATSQSHEAWTLPVPSSIDQDTPVLRFETTTTTEGLDMYDATVTYITERNSVPVNASFGVHYDSQDQKNVSILLNGQHDIGGDKSVVDQTAVWLHMSTLIEQLATDAEKSSRVLGATPELL